MCFARNPNTRHPKFEDIGLSLIGDKKTKKGMCRFKAHFNMEPDDVGVVWEKLWSNGLMNLAGQRGPDP